MKVPTLQELQNMHDFKQPLTLYTMGISGKPEERAQKAFIQCLMAEFPEELGHYEPLNIYSALVIATADFYSGGRSGMNQMQRYKKMGYQKGTPDILILHPVKGLCGFVCEMKAGRNKATEEQERTLDCLHDRFFYTCVGYGFEGALWHWLLYIKGGNHE